MVFSIVADVATDVGAVRREDVEPRPDLVERARRVPGIGALGDGPQGLLRAGAADQDRQVRLDRSRLAERVLQRVEAADMAEPLAVEQAPDEHDRLVQPVEPLADAGGEVDAVGVVLALEPGAADPEHCAPARDVIERDRELRGQTRVAHGVGADHQPEANPAR